MLIYLSFPWWVKPLIIQYIPQTISIDSIDIAYPSLSGIKVNSVNLKQQDYHIKIEGLWFDYSFKNINLQLIVVEALQKRQSKQAELNLPQLNITQISSHLTKITGVNLLAKQIIYKFNEEQLTINDLQFSTKNLLTNSNSQSKPFVLNWSKIIYNHKVIPLANQPQILIKPIENSFTFSYLENNQPLADIEYLNHSSTSMIKANVSTKLLNKVKAHFHSYSKALPQLSFTDPLSIVLEQSKALLPPKVHLTTSAKNSGLNVKLAHFNIEISELSRQGFSLKALTDLTFQHNKLLAEPLVKTQITSNVNLTSEITFNDVIMSASLDHLSAHHNNTELHLNNIKILSKPINLTAEQLRNKNFVISIEQSVEKLLLKSNEFKLIGSMSNQLNLHALNDLKTKSEIKINSFDWFKDDQLTSNTQADNIQISNATIAFLMSIENAFNSSDKPNTKISALKIQANQLQTPNLYFDSLLADLNGSILDQLINLSGYILLNDTFKMPLGISYQVNNKKGNTKLIETQQEITNLNFLLNQLKPESIESITFNEGKIKLKGQVNIDPSLSLSVHSNLSNVSMNVDENYINNLHLTTQANLSNKQITTDSKLIIDEIQLSSGINLSNLSATIINQNNTIKVNHLMAKLFEGNLQINQLIRAEGSIQPTTIKLNHISLFELISFFDLESLFVDGTIDIDLPIASKGKEIVVNKGYFKSVKAGVIKYNSQADLSESDNIALKALQNFQYQALDGSIDYDSAGNYKIKLHILGANPEVYNGYPLDFTFNINGHLPGLFKSLFLSGDFEQSILDSINQN